MVKTDHYMVPYHGNIIRDNTLTYFKIKSCIRTVSILQGGTNEYNN